MRDDPRSVLAAFDRALTSGDAGAMAELFANDAQLLLLYQDAVVGREAIHAQWVAIFSEFDTSAWQAEYPILDAHGDRAYALSTYLETMVPRAGGPSILIRGRAVYFLRRDPDDSWRIALALNSHLRPPEELA